MLQLILGRTGTGKTDTLARQIGEVLGRGGQVLYLVPEQFSFETEREMLGRAEEIPLLHLQITSFSRLAEEITAHCTNGAAQPLGPSARRLMAAKAAMAVSDGLRLYGRQSLSPSFIELCVRTIDDFQNARISPLALEALGGVSRTDTLGQKLADIGLIYAAYEGLCVTSGLDPAGKIEQAATLALETGYFARFHIFIDGFTGFSALQHQLLRVILRQAQQVTVALCCDSLSDRSDGLGVFSPVHKTVQQLISNAKKEGATVRAPLVLQQNLRYSSPELVALEAGLADPAAPPYPEKTERVFAAEFEDIYQEIRFICSEIWRLVRCEEYRFRDIVIITRNLEENADLFENVFAAYGIPLFFDRREDIGSKPLFVFLSTLFDVACGGFRTSDLLRLAKTGALGLSDEETAALENYSYIWSLTGAQWKEPFTLHPQGLCANLLSEDQAELERLNASRDKLVGPVLRFINETKDGTGLELSRAVFTFLEAAGVYENLAAQARELRDGREEKLYGEYRAVWDCLTGLLDQLAGVFGDTPLTLTQYARLFSLMSAHTDLGAIPNTVDQVTLGSADRIRPAGCKAAFVANLCQGVFPADQPKSGFFTRRELDALEKKGIELPGAPFDFAAEENLYAYKALCCPTDRLYLSFARAGRSFEKQAPSRYFAAVRGIFPQLENISPQTLPPGFFVCNTDSALEQLVRGETAHSSLPPSLEAVLQQNPTTKKELLAIRQAAAPRPFAIADPRIARQLFGKRLRLSASRIERYYNCRFAYFLEYALKIRRRKKADITPLESGSLIHEVLHRFVEQSGAGRISRMTDAELRARVRGLTADYLKANLGPPESLNARQKYLIRRIEKALCEILRHIGEEFEQCAFEPVDFELSIGPDGDIPPLVLQTADGNEVSVEGVVDRLDLLRKNGISYVRVVDYKTGTKEFKLRDVYYGLNLQMLLYLFTIWKNGGKKYGELMPAGVLYVPARQSVTSAERGDDEAALEAVRKSFRANGLLLDDLSILEAMDRDISGIYIPVARNKDGSLKASEGLASLAQLGKLRDFIERKVVDMASGMLGGKIEACPATDGVTSPCDYCSYRAVCLKESGEEQTLLCDMGKEAFYECIGEDTNKQGASQTRDA